MENYELIGIFMTIFMIAVPFLFYWIIKNLEFSPEAEKVLNSKKNRFEEYFYFKIGEYPVLKIKFNSIFDIISVSFFSFISVILIVLFFIGFDNLISSGLIVVLLIRLLIPIFALVMMGNVKCAFSQNYFFVRNGIGFSSIAFQNEFIFNRENLRSYNFKRNSLLLYVGDKDSKRNYCFKIKNLKESQINQVIAVLNNWQVRKHNS